ncbi:nucleotide exchange factor GrpE [Prauserella oleivorans]
MSSWLTAPFESGSTDTSASRVAELTEDLQRLGAEYANYRKRAERTRRAAAEQAHARLITALLPALDTLDRAEQHGELTGPLRAVADTFQDALAKVGVVPVGQVGDRFDPAQHDAVEHHHSTAAEVLEPVVSRVHRRGYRLGAHILRPALVAVTEPEPELLDPTGTTDGTVAESDSGTEDREG